MRNREPPRTTWFFRLTEDANCRLVDALRVLEIGSYDVNGSVREIFGGCSEYVGVDLREGPPAWTASLLATS